MPSGGAVVRTAAQLWEMDWDEEDQADQQRQNDRKMKRSVTPVLSPAAPTRESPECWDDTASTSETPDCWDDTDAETLVGNLRLVKPMKPAVVEKKPEAKPLVDGFAAKQLPDREVVLADKEVAAPKVKPVIEKRFWGTVRWFRGCYGWVTCDNVRTDRTVNPQGYCTTEITNAIFLHKSDCPGFVARGGMDVNFRVEPDTQGKLKCVDVRQERPEDQRMTLDDYILAKREKKLKSKEQVADSKSIATDSELRATVSSHGTTHALKPNHKASKAKLSREVSSDGTQSWLEARMQATRKPLQKANQAKLSRGNLELHHQESGSDCSSTAAGLTSCSASVASELDVQSQASIRAGRPKYTSSAETERAERPWYMHSSIAASIARVSRCVEIEEIEEPTDEVASDQPPIAESWEDEVEDEVSGEAPDGIDTKVTMGYIRRSEQTVDVGIDEPTEDAAPDQPPVAESWDQPPVAASVAESWEVDEVPKCWCPKRPRQKLANKKVAKPTAAPQEGQLAEFCRAMGPQFPFEFVARHLGTDFDAIVQSASDVHSLDSLVQAGMKPLNRNKFCKALRQEKEQHATRGESPKYDLADFLAEIGPEFDRAFLARHLGTDDLDEIITQFTHVDDFEVLIVAGMKPLFRNKLHRQFELERKRRAAKC
jgi:hypothetical protein